MRALFGRKALVLLGVAGMCLASAKADLIFTFGYTDLAAAFHQQDGLLDVVSDGDTDGDVTRVTPSMNTALFAAPDLDADAIAGYEMSMEITNVTPATADGEGEFMITDADGDTITGTIRGIWTRINPFFSAFAGELDDIVLTDNGDADGEINGTAGGGFSMDFAPVAAPYTGAIVELLFSSGAWFDSDFRDFNTLVSAQVVPEPSSLGLLACGLLAYVRRGRR